MISRNIIAAPKMIALISIYRAISQYIDYRDRPTGRVRPCARGAALVTSSN